MKYIRNPITNVVRQVSPLEAKRLLGYNWVRATAAEHWQYQRQIQQAIVEQMKRKSEARAKLN